MKKVYNNYIEYIKHAVGRDDIHTLQDAINARSQTFLDKHTKILDLASFESNRGLYYVADFETHKVINISEDTVDESNFMLMKNNLVQEIVTESDILFGYMKRLSDEDEKDYKLFYSIQQFLDLLVAEAKLNKKAATWCYFHNLTFDGSYIMSWLLKQGYGEVIGKQSRFLKNGEFMKLGDETKLINCVFRYKSILMNFGCSYLTYPNKLADIGKLIGYDKLAHDWKGSDELTPEFLEYGKRDVEIMFKAWQKGFFDLNILRCKTRGSYAYDLVKKTIAKYIPKYQIKDFIIDNNFYQGGYTCPLPKCIGKHVHTNNKIRAIDINSSYPSQMCGKLPYDRKLYNEKLIGKDINEVINIPNFDEYYFILDISKVIIKEKYIEEMPLFPRKLSEKIIKLEDSKILISDNKVRGVMYDDELPEKTFLQYVYSLRTIYGEGPRYYLIGAELIEFMKRYEIKAKIVDCWTYLYANWLEKIIKPLWLEKDAAKKRGDIVGAFNAKLNINSISGKMGQSSFYETTYYFRDKVDLVENKLDFLSEKKGKFAWNNVDYAIRCRCAPKLTARAHPVFVIAWITANARAKLFREMTEMIERGDKPQYCDTDSIFYIDNSNVDYSTGTLGDFIFEEDKINKQNVMKCDSFCSLGPKHYITYNNNIIIKSAHGGITKASFANIRPDKYNYDLLFDKLSKVMTRNGISLENTTFNFNKYKKYKYKKVLLF